MQIIIPMSGIGKRFVEAGYKEEIQGSEKLIRLVETHFNTTIKNGAQLWKLQKGSPKDKEEIEYSQFIVDSSNIFRYEVYLYYLGVLTSSS